MIVSKLGRCFYLIKGRFIENKYSDFVKREINFLINKMYVRGNLVNNICRGEFMFYSNLKELVNMSSSSRHFFMSLPAADQIELNEHNDYIHSAAELREKVYFLENLRHYDEISGFDRLKLMSKKF